MMRTLSRNVFFTPCTFRPVAVTVQSGASLATRVPARGRSREKSGQSSALIQA